MDDQRSFAPTRNSRPLAPSGESLAQYSRTSNRRGASDRVTARVRSGRASRRGRKKFSQVYSPAASRASASALIASVTAAYPATTSARLSPAPAAFSCSTARSNRAQRSSEPRRPVPGRSSYGGRAWSELSMGRHARPDSSARAWASRIRAADSDSARSRARNCGSGGASSCARIAAAQAPCASRTASHTASLRPAPSLARRCSDASTRSSYRTSRRINSVAGAESAQSAHQP